ncbi:MAG: helix-turn-helix domain-containing protein [Spirochaetaceae bacterium]|nr:helix-turn-helix domain-containing protein [Spirochaetia bacterium]MCF7951876.1 helix-turn-helix domain-containing protein [Spirochaetaceae bacterium]
MQSENLPQYDYFQAAEILGISHATLRRWVADGKIKNYFKLGNKVRFSQNHISEILKSLEVHV